MKDSLTSITTSFKLDLLYGIVQHWKAHTAATHKFSMPKLLSFVILTPITGELWWPPSLLTLWAEKALKKSLLNGLFAPALWPLVYEHHYLKRNNLLHSIRFVILLFNKASAFLHKLLLILWRNARVYKPSIWPTGQQMQWVGDHRAHVVAPQLTNHEMASDNQGMWSWWQLRYRYWDK